jgi:transposase
LLAASTFNRTGGDTTMTDQTVSDEFVMLRVIGGVDTHKDVHVAAVLDELGRLLDTASFAATPAGYRRLSTWLCGHGEVLAVGVEGTGSWGAGLSRFLRARGVNVIEVNRTNRQTRAPQRQDRHGRRRSCGACSAGGRRDRHPEIG